MATKRTGAARSAGRPTIGPEPLSAQINVRVTEAERDEIERAAEADRRRLTEWCRLAMVDAARSPK